MSKHTPGPWFIEWDTDTIRYGEENTATLNENSQKVKIFSGDEGRANARLVAAAPELLDACKVALFCLDSPVYKDLADCKAARAQLVAAIAKAEGQEGKGE